MTEREGERTSVLNVYERHGAAWAELRSDHLIEEPWLDRFCYRLVPRAAVLDIGCGAGLPIARELVRRGFAVTGVDGTPAMLALFRRNLPGTPTHLVV